MCAGHGAQGWEWALGTWGPFASWDPRTELGEASGEVGRRSSVPCTGPRSQGWGGLPGAGKACPEPAPEARAPAPRMQLLPVASLLPRLADGSTGPLECSRAAPGPGDSPPLPWKPRPSCSCASALPCPALLVPSPPQMDPPARLLGACSAPSPSRRPGPAPGAWGRGVPSALCPPGPGWGGPPTVTSSWGLWECFLLGRSLGIWWLFLGVLAPPQPRTAGPTSWELSVPTAGNWTEDGGGGGWPLTLEGPPHSAALRADVSGAVPASCRPALPLPCGALELPAQLLAACF